MECPKCKYRWLDHEENGSYYEDNNLIKSYFASCSKCGAVYQYETVEPIVEITMRNFKEME